MGLFDKKIKPAAKQDKPETAGADILVKADKVAKPVKSAPAEKTIAVASSDKRGVYGVLISPLITEKSTKDEQYGKYVFAVEVGATKSEIIKAIATRYGVKPVKVNVLNRAGKFKRFGKSWGQRKDWRKAVITLPQGKSINVYEASK